MNIKKKIAKYLGLVLALSFAMSVFAIPQTASADLCDELSQGTGGFFSCGEGETTFTAFQGGFDPPSADGYDPTLTQQTNLRDFIVNAVNFGLGFLGLVAVIVVIYGGFLYVTAAGEEEKTTKGKQSIMYAMIGILIILVSYALVNTVIKGVGKGTDKGVDTEVEMHATVGGEELTGDQTAAINRLFYMAATKVERSAKDLATAYTHYVDINDLLADLNNVPKADTPEGVRVFLNNLKRAVHNVVTSTDSLSQLNEYAKVTEDYVDGWLYATDKQLADEVEDVDIIDLYWDFDDIEDMVMFDVTGKDGKYDYNGHLDFFKYDNFNDLQNNLDDMTGDFEFFNYEDFALIVEGIIEDLEDLKAQIESSGLVTTEETEFGLAYDRAINVLQELTYSGPVTNIQIVDALEAMSDLHTVVQNIKFVAAVIKADVDNGNGPLIVNFDALSSVRPDFESIKEEDIEWDFGDGNTVSGRFATSHVYRKTGNYIAKLNIKGDSAKNIASGVAFKNITVKPPASQINLKVAIGGRDLGYMSYYKDGFLTIDKNRLNVTLTEARETGITFDASESRGGFQSEQSQEAGETYIQRIEWNFGDNTDKVNGEMVAEDVQTHYYGEEGTYPVIIEVTDSRGIRDRKVFEVVVDSPAARIDVTPSRRIKINENVTFDAGGSTSDGGQIVAYNWSVENTSLHYSADEKTEEFTKDFESPGVYQVSLAITDNLGNTAHENSALIVESEAPKAQFDYEMTDVQTPHIYMLDGSKSFDPDGNIKDGDYIYKWSVNTISDDYDFVDESGDIDIDGPFKIRTYIKFYRIGEYDVSLQVDDVNEPENPGVPLEKTIDVKSILDVAFGPIDTAAAMLNDDNEAQVTLKALSENGIAYEFDFGDETSPVSGNIISSQGESSHIYTEAGAYDVRLTVFDKQNNENTIKRRIIVGNSDAPIPVISVKVDGVEIYDFSEPIKVNRKTIIEFDASQSINIDGTGRRLAYQWDFADTDKSTQSSTTHTYDDLSPADPGYYNVQLKVMDKNDLSKNAVANVKIDVTPEMPEIQAFTAVVQDSQLVTPVRVKLNAIGANDPDGQIVKYLWWYYDERDPEMTMGHTITQTPEAFVTVGTRGVEGEQINYKFGLAMTDQENFEIDASEILDPAVMPSITVTNGPNDIPVSRFTVDRTSVMVGEAVNFTSSSYDPDGRIVQYIWDFEGDGFSDNKATNLSTVSHIYNTPAVDGINVRLKVIDDNFAESVAIPIKVYVDTVAEAPVAAFKTEYESGNTMKFINNSTADEEAGAKLVKYIWDFDVSSDLNTADSDGDGIKDNDNDSNEASPQFDYLQGGVYRVKLRVEDNLGNWDEVINFVNVLGSELGNGTGEVVEAKPLKADFVTNPDVSADNKIHLSGDSGEISFNFASSEGDIATYVFDDNIYVDSNNNGRKADDSDYSATFPGIYTTTFNAESGKIKVRLSVYDEDGNVDIKELFVVFDKDAVTDGDLTDSLGANILLGTNQNQVSAMVVSLVLFAIVILSLYLYSARIIEQD